MGIFHRKAQEPSLATVIHPAVPPVVVRDCFCGQGHDLTSDLACFDGRPGITLQLRDSTQQGLLALSPVVGDKRRTFFNFERHEGAIVQIGCPVCAEPLPVYNRCSCGANLVAMFTTRPAEFANCIGICQRIGCLHAEIISNRQLRRYSRRGYFD